jgi:hypothetical protein
MKELFVQNSARNLEQTDEERFSALSAAANNKVEEWR